MKKKMQSGGSLSGLKASTKRVGPVDPKGAYTKVQEKTLAGAKGKASLKKDKQLGATKMKMGGKIAKDGASFPDLNKDGKITQADILKGLGVIAKKGASVKKAQMGATMTAAPIMKKGGSMKKCKYGCK
jgi:hypothetical protein